MPELMVLMDRIEKLTGILFKMCHEPDFKKFCELNKQFGDTVTLNKIEDELNAADNNSTTL